MTDPTIAAEGLAPLGLPDWRRRILDRTLLAGALFDATASYDITMVGLASLLGLSTPDVRLPLVPASPAARERVEAAMKAAGLI